MNSCYTCYADYPYQTDQSKNEIFAKSHTQYWILFPHVLFAFSCIYIDYCMFSFFCRGQTDGGVGPGGGPHTPIITKISRLIMLRIIVKTMAVITSRKNGDNDKKTRL